MALLAGSACSTPDPVTADTLPLPPFAYEAPLAGAYESRLDLAVVALHRPLREAYGPFDPEIVHLEESATWDAVEAFYTEAFSSGDLAASGFERTDWTSADPDRYRVALWTRDRGDRVAVAFVPGRPGDPKPFLVLMTPRAGSSPRG